MNRYEEESIIARFKNTCPHFPIGVIAHPDKPDFIVQGAKTIGIEVTQVFKDQDSPTGSLIKAKDTFRRNLLSSITSDLKASNFPKCIFAIHLNDRAYSRKLSAHKISKLCFADILSNQNLITGYGDFEFQNEGNLPEIIEAYTVSVFEGISEIEFVETTGAVGLPLTNEYIQFILDKKDKAKKDFKKCDSYWLLIKEGSFEADYFGIADIDNSKLNTTFDKVFLLRQRRSEIMELK